MVDQATAKYLGDNIGGVLAKALGEMAIAQPRDGVEYLAKWLKLHVEQEEARAARELEEAKLVEERAKAQERLSTLAARKLAREEEVQAKEDTFKEFLERLRDPEIAFEDTWWSELLAVARTLTGAKSAYIGLVDEEGLEGVAGPLIRYTEASPGSEFMKDKTLMQGQGVTWGAVTENPGEDVPYLWRPPQPAPAEPNPDDPDAAPAEPVVIPYLPVSVECVTDAKEMYYFDMTRLGAYLAVPLVYSSYYTPEAYAACKVFEEERKVQEKKREEILQAYEAAVEEARAQGGDDAAAAVERPPELDAVDTKQMTLPGKVVKMVLCVDTLGTNALIDEGCFERALELGQTFAKCRQEAEKRHVDTQVLVCINEEHRATQQEQIDAAWARAEAETAEAASAEEATIAADEDQARGLVGKKWAYMKAARVFLELKEEVLSLATWVVPTPEMMNLIEATALFFGYSKDELYPKRKAALDWQVLRRVLDDRFCTAVQDADPAAPRKGLQDEQKLSSIKAKRLADFTSEKAKEVSPALEVLHALLDAAIEYRTGHLLLLKAEYTKRQEAEGEDFADGPLEQTDDDFEGL